MDNNWPTALAFNAWTGEEIASGDVAPSARSWALGKTTSPPKTVPKLAPPKDADLSTWGDSRVGWGLVLPDRPDLSEQELAAGTDAPDPIQELLKARGNAPVFRFRPGDTGSFTFLRDHRNKKDVSIQGSPFGLAPGALPFYLLLYGNPAELPWELQYVLNARSAGRQGAVGRLDLTGDALENYVGALLSDWKDADMQIGQAVVWAVDHGPDDITRLMRNAIAAKVHADYEGDTEIASTFFDGAHGPATTANLIGCLAAKRPGVVVTTSHGKTGPLSDPQTMKGSLGLPVDQNYGLLHPNDLLAKWEPDGAVWYAHACCSAGGDSETIFEGVVEAGSSAYQVLKAVADLGACVAPLPRALLGAKKPLRAFVGHVEPTFDWTLRQPQTGQHLTDSIRRTLYNNLFSGQPVGLALTDAYRSLAAYYATYDKDIKAYNKGNDKILPSALYCQLAARDTQTLVLLGDPAAALPKLPPIQPG